MTEKKNEKCSFCGLNKKNISFMISGNKSFICDRCVKLSYEIMEEFYENNNKEETLKNLKNINIKDLYEFLNKFVVGQEHAKKILSVSIYNHYKKITSNTNQKDDDTYIDKSNILIIGNTGAGKTFLVKNLAKYLDLPMITTDATCLTETGYAGQDVESIMSRLIQAADYDISKAEYGIVYIDEIDKISKKNSDNGNAKDISGEGVQQALLKMIEGSIVYVPNVNGKRHGGAQEVISINTENILFIFAGSFHGLKDIVENRINSKNIGFINNKTTTSIPTNIINNLNTQDLIHYGLIPEFCGRIPIIITLDDINRNTLIDIMKKPKNSILEQYKKLFSLSNVTINFDNSAIEEIANQAFKLKTGARALKSIMEKELLNIMFEINCYKNKNITIYSEKKQFKYKTIG